MVEGNNGLRYVIGQDKGRYRVTISDGKGKRRRWYTLTKCEATTWGALLRLKEAVEQGEVWPLDKNTDLDIYRTDAPPPGAPLSKGKPPATLLKAFDAWVDTLGLRPETRNGQYHDIRSMIPPDAKLEDTSWWDNKTKHLAAWTHNKRRQTIAKCVYEILERKTAWDRVPKRRVADIADNANPLTRDEAALLLSHINDYYRELLWTMFDTGLRVSEVLGLRWCDFTAHGLTIKGALVRDRSVSGRGSSRTLRTKTTKNGVVRTIPLSEELHLVLEKRRPVGDSPESLIFVGKHGGVVSDQSLRSAVNKAYDAAGIKRRRLCESRHTRLSWVAETGGMIAAAAWAGHRNSTTVAKYYARHTQGLSQFTEDWHRLPVSAP
jgi:integrase